MSHEETLLPQIHLCVEQKIKPLLARHKGSIEIVELTAKKVLAELADEKLDSKVNVDEVKKKFSKFLDINESREAFLVNYKISR